MPAKKKTQKAAEGSRKGNGSTAAADRRFQCTSSQKGDCVGSGERIDAEEGAATTRRNEKSN